MNEMMIKKSNDLIKQIDIWPLKKLQYFGECWDCGHPFRKYQEIKIDEKYRIFHKRCARRRVWREKVFTRACTVLQRMMPYAKTPLLFKTTDNVQITAPEGWEAMLQQFGTVIQFLGFSKNE